MKKRMLIFITIVAIILAVGFFIETSSYYVHSYEVDFDLIDFNSMQFDEECAVAYGVLLNTDGFAYGPVGYAGSTPDEIHAFGKLLVCENAIDYFIKIEQEATIEGKMYALCGLYYLDYANYKTYIEKYLNDSTEILTIRGCLGFEHPVKDLIKDDRAVRLMNIRDTTDKWVKRNRQDWYVCDFYGGGIPSSVLYFTGLGRFTIETIEIEILGYEIQLSSPKRLD